MSTTTIRLPDSLKARVAKAARRSKQTTHGFILEAIAEKAEQEERRSAFHDLAEERYERIVASGKTLAWADVRKYLEARMAGKTARRPRAGKPAR